MAAIWSTRLCKAAIASFCCSPSGQPRQLAGLTLYLHNVDDIPSSVHDALQLVGEELHILLPVHHHLLSPGGDIDLCLQLHFQRDHHLGTYLEDLDEIREIFSSFDNLSGVLVCLEILFKERFDGESGQQLGRAVKVPGRQLKAQSMRWKQLTAAISRC